MFNIKFSGKPFSFFPSYSTQYFQRSIFRISVKILSSYIYACLNRHYRQINKYGFSYLLKLYKTNFKRRAINMLRWHFILSKWLNWEAGNTNDDCKRIFLVWPDQNTNSLTKLQKYPVLTHFPSAILNSLKHSLPNQQEFHFYINILRGSSTENQKYFLWWRTNNY